MTGDAPFRQLDRKIEPKVSQSRKHTTNNGRWRPAEIIFLLLRQGSPIHCQDHNPI